jgi:hypothetical protein
MTRRRPVRSKYERLDLHREADGSYALPPRRLDQADTNGQFPARTLALRSEARALAASPLTNPCHLRYDTFNPFARIIRRVVGAYRNGPDRDRRRTATPAVTPPSH